MEICAERSCDTILETIDATGMSAVPTADLRVGTVFWRLTARTGSTLGIESSATWQINVGRRSAAIDTSWGATLDVNGDGYSDVLAAASAADSLNGRAYVFHGGSAGLPMSPTTILLPPSDVVGGAFGDWLDAVGDINGDGYSDAVIVGGRGAGIWIYYGGPDGLVDGTGTEIQDPAGGYLGGRVAAAGDINSDGYADLLLTGLSGSVSVIYFYTGSSSGISSSPTTTILDPVGSSNRFGVSVDGNCDVNGDTRPDLIVGDDSIGSNAGVVYVYYGDESGVPSLPPVPLPSPDGAGFGWRLACADDVNGDGYGDVVVGAPGALTGAGRAYLFLGSTGGLPMAPSAVLPRPDTGQSSFGQSVGGAGDVNGDGFADVIVSAVNPSIAETGRSYVFVGGSGAFSTAPARPITGPDLMGAFGVWVGGVGDVNGDTYPDFAVGAYKVMTNTGRIYVYPGSGIAVAGSALYTLNPPDSGGFFGYVIAMLEPPSMPPMVRTVHSRPQSGLFLRLGG